MVSSRASSSSGTFSSTASLLLTWKSRRMKARLGEGRRRPVAPRSHGESVVTFGSWRSLRISSGPCSSIACERAPKEDDEGGRVAEVFVLHAGGPAGLGAVDFDRARIEPALEAEAENRQDRDDQGADGQRPLRVAQHQRRPRLLVPLSARTVASAPCSSSQARSIVWRSERPSGADVAEDSVKGRFPGRLDWSASLSMWRRTLKRLLAAGALICCVLFAGAANAALVRVGNLVLTADGGFTPSSLPRSTYAPINFKGEADLKAVGRQRSARRCSSWCSTSTATVGSAPPACRFASPASLEEADDAGSARPLPGCDRRHRARQRGDRRRAAAPRRQLSPDLLQRPPPGRQADRDHARAHHRAGGAELRRSRSRSKSALVSTATERRWTCRRSPAAAAL